MTRRQIVLLALSLIAVCAVGAVLAASARRPRWDFDGKAQVAQGQAVYRAQCAGCHGAALEGQAGWQRPGVDGLLPAPPHDDSGHTWQHSDRELTELIAHSVASFAPPGYRTAMPAYADVLSQAEIRAVIAYIKSTWPAGVRAYQATLNPGGPSLADIPGDWRFPPTCGYRLPD